MTVRRWLRFGLAAGVAWGCFFGGGGTPPGEASPPPVVVRGFVGSEKLGFFQDPQVTDLLARKYGIVLRVLKSGSLEMGRQKGAADFLFPASGWAADRASSGAPRSADPEVLFWTPVVVYSWKPVVRVLEEKKVAALRDGALRLGDLKTLAGWVERGTRWADLGLPALPGRVVVLATDPTRSHSGLSFSVLVAAALRDGQPPTADSLPALLPTLRELFARQGVLQPGTQDLFDQWERTGMAVSPLAVGYESQIVELARTRPRDFARVRDSLALLYPDPLLWSAHAFVPLTGAGVRLKEALRDPQLRRLAWERHGLRTDPQEPPQKIPGLEGLAPGFPRVLPLPEGPVLEALSRGLEGVVPKVP